MIKINKKRLLKNMSILIFTIIISATIIGMSQISTEIDKSKIEVDINENNNENYVKTSYLDKIFENSILLKKSL